MRKGMIALLLLLPWLPGMASASGGAHFDPLPVSTDDMDSLRRGARLFTEHCMNCHSLKYLRYGRLVSDLGMSEEEVTTKLMRSGGKLGDTMKAAVDPVEAQRVYGTKVPDLTLLARAKGSDYLYTYLRGFYLDSSKTFGVDNLAFPGVAMPNVLAGLQGLQQPVYRTVEGVDGEPQRLIERLELVQPGQLEPAAFDTVAADITNFLTYAAEPAMFDRQRKGPWVLLFIAFFTGLAYLLKKEYWRDVH